MLTSWLINLSFMSVNLVIPNPLAYDMGWVGDWNGSSCVAIGRHWAITAAHTGGGPGSGVRYKGQNYQVVERVVHPTADLALLRFVEPLDDWHPLGTSLQHGDDIIVGGYGLTGAVGSNWVFPRAERWGTNIVQSAYSQISFDFSAPSDSTATPHESSAALNDSGGGVFSTSSDGTLYLEGVIVTTSPFGSSPYGANNYAIKLAPFIPWIQQNISDADWNGDGVVNVPDIFSFLTDWHARAGLADFDDNGIENVQDIFAFISVWQANRQI